MTDKTEFQIVIGVRFEDPWDAERLEPYREEIARKLMVVFGLLVEEKLKGRVEDDDESGPVPVLLQ